MLIKIYYYYLEPFLSQQSSYPPPQLYSSKQLMQT